MLTLYLVSLSIICAVAVAAVVHPHVHTGTAGTAALAALTLSALAATETTDPARSTVGLAVSGALVALWIAGSWAWRRKRWRRRSTDLREIRRVA